MSETSPNTLPQLPSVPNAHLAPHTGGDSLTSPNSSRCLAADTPPLSRLRCHCRRHPPTLLRASRRHAYTHQLDIILPRAPSLAYHRRSSRPDSQHLHLRSTALRPASAP